VGNFFHWQNNVSAAFWAICFTTASGHPAADLATCKIKQTLCPMSGQTNLLHLSFHFSIFSASFLRPQKHKSE
jgi:hypothetical protein